jgi:cobaltochelatase CobT
MVGQPDRDDSSLLHITYNRADEKAWALESSRTMLHPDILRENIDGEAIAWAAGRLRKRREATKFLLVISDGAPVDDSTLQENGSPYLERHVLSIIGNIQDQGDIVLGAIGVGYAVDRYYQLSTRSDDPSQILDVTGRLIALMMLE